MGATFGDGVGEGERRHIGTAPGAIDGEQPEAGGRHAEEVRVGMGQRLGAALGGGVDRHRVVGAVGLDERRRWMCAIDRAGRGDEQMFWRRGAQRLEQIERAGEIGR